MVQGNVFLSMKPIFINFFGIYSVQIWYLFIYLRPNRYYMMPDFEKAQNNDRALLIYSVSAISTRAGIACM